METTGALLKKCQSICEIYEKDIPGVAKGELFYQFCDDMIHMAFLLAASDDDVDIKQIDLISYTFGVAFDYNTLAISYGLDCLSENSFIKQVPPSIKIIGGLEKRDNPAPNCILDNTRIFHTAMKQFGSEVLHCTRATLKYSVMVQQYFINGIMNYIFWMEGADGFAGTLLDDAMAFTIRTLTPKNSSGHMNYTQIRSGSVYSSNQGNLNSVNIADAMNDNGGGFRDDRTVGGLKLKTWAPTPEDNKNTSGSVSAEVEADTEMNQEGFRGNMQLSSSRFTSSEFKTKSSSGKIGNSPIDMDTINEILADVDGLIGLGNVKKEIHDMVNMMIVNEMRRRKGLKNPVMSRHLVFTGNPGTGKTTIARVIGRIYKTLGILEKGHMIETDRSGMVAGYMGQTAEKVNDVVKQAKGGILFIDEAYSLVSENEGDFGQEAINTLLKLMEDNRDSLVVIVAGYTEEMKDIINSNPGLRSRFNKYIQFEDYSDDELLQIFKTYVDEQDYILEEDIDDVILTVIRQIRADEGDNFGNARSMRNFFEKVISNQANRLISVGALESEGEDDLMKIKKEDILT